jgi:multimeric flavodoxin WrbA
MKKIIALIGSRGANSNTAKLAGIVVDKIKESNPGKEFEYELLFPEQWNLKPCISCNNCFSRGFCVLDESDGMAGLKQKMFGADVVIMGSPVFAAHVSGDTKHLVDRLSMWLHTMPLIGKYGMVLSTTSNNNGDAVVDYLDRMASLMGLMVVVKFNAYVHAGQPMLSDAAALDALLQEPVKTLSEALFNGNRPTINDMLHLHYIFHSRMFNKQKKIAEKYPIFASGEAKLWEEQGYMPYGTIQELLEGLNK